MKFKYLSEKIEDIEQSFYKFDGRRLLEEKKSINKKEFLTRYGYNASGHLAALYYPSGLTVNYEYNDSFEVKAISVSLGEKKTDVWKMEKKEASSSITFGNGLVTTITSDPQKPVVFQKTGNIQDLEYVFNDKRLIDRVKDKLDLKNKRDFYYDSEERLLTAYGPWGKATYGYDSMDNLIYKDDNGKKTTLACPPKSSRIKEIKEDEKIISYTYDPLGNTIQYGEYKFEYNIRGRLAKIFKNDALIVELFYNTKGQRVMEKRGEKINYYVYDNKDRVLGRYNENGQAIQEYIYETEIPVAFIRNNQIYYYHYDLMHFPVMITDESGKPVRRIQYKPYGEIIKEEGKITDSLRYPGQYEIESMDFYYNYSRIYNPFLTRYFENDPEITIDNAFEYAKNNPLKYLDKKGYQSTELPNLHTYKVGNLGCSTLAKTIGIIILSGTDVKSDCWHSKIYTDKLHEGWLRLEKGSFTSIFFLASVGFPISATDTKDILFYSIKPLSYKASMSEFEGKARYRGAGLALGKGGSGAEMKFGNVSNYLEFGEEEGFDVGISISLVGKSWVTYSGDIYCCEQFFRKAPGTW